MMSTNNLGLMKTLLPFLAMLACCGSTTSVGQEKDSTGVFPSRDEYNRFFGGLKALGDPEINAMLPMINDIVLGRPVGSTPIGKGGGSGVMDLLGDPKVRGELEMADFQYDKLKSLSSDIQKRMGDQVRSIDFSNPKEIAEQVRNIREQAEKGLQDVFLPHQMSRLRQLSTQSQLRRRSLAEILTSEPLRSELEISNSQEVELKESEEEIEMELAEEIAKLRAKARGKLLSNLKRSQREKVEELFGDAFEFSHPKTDKLRAKR
jgi:hypothetical protein